MRVATAIAVLLAAAGTYRPGCGGKPPAAPPPTCEAAAADPCAGKACGAECTIEGCGPAGLGFCDASGECGAAQPACATGYDPCAGKACGDPCTACPPHDPGCVETAVLKACDADGRCVPAAPSPSCPG